MANDYNAISAKLKAMSAGCLTKRDFEQMAAKTGISEVFEYLKENTSYSGVLSGMDSSELHRENIEARLNEFLFEQYRSVYSFMNNSQKRIFHFWIMQHEIDFLKHAIRRTLNYESLLPDREIPDAFFKTHTRIDCDAVVKADNLRDITEACRNTQYYHILKTTEQINPDFFSLVMTLDRLYYMELWKYRDTVGKEERDSFCDFIGPTIDMLNLVWIYRGKKYYRFQKETIYTYLIPVRYKLSKEDIVRIVEAETAEAAEQAIKETRYRALFDNKDDGVFIEDNNRRIKRRYAKRIFVTQPCSMAAVFAYFRLKKMEIANITTIIEGKRYNMSPEVIRKHING